jgi:2-methylisocitrate lyase-like PEP mutase family enzyme
MKALIGTGIAGINFEDGQPEGPGLISTDLQCEKISLIRKTSLALGMPLFINARTDVYISGQEASPGEKVSEAIRRGKAYREAGADCFYPIALTDRNALRDIISEVGLPVNVLLLPGIPGFSELKEMGVARLSLGSGYLHTALHAMKDIAEKLLAQRGMEEITHNPVTSDYVKNLINYELHEKDQY